MDELNILRTVAASTTILAAAMVAANMRSHNRCRLRDLHCRVYRLDGGRMRKQIITGDSEGDSSSNQYSWCVALAAKG
jgi:hypothetical protein